MTADLSAATATVVDTGRRHGTFHPLRVAAVEPLTDEAVAITFAVPDELRAAYAFDAGQHLTLRTEVAGEEVRRNYSICAPATEGRLRIGVKRLDGGAFSTHATSTLQVGDEVEVMTPTGRFTPRLDPAQARHYAAIAAGSGITPVISIVATALEVEPRSTVTLVYGNRTAGSVMFLEELADDKDRYKDRLQLVHVLSREERDAELLTGRIDAAKLDRLLATIVPPDDVDQWLLCGPFEMVEQVRGELVARGVPNRRIHLELFHVDGEPLPVRRTSSASGTTDADAAEVTVRLDGRTTTFRMPPEGSVLDAALAVRSDAPFACKGGVCGTCRARLVEGRVTMARRYALDDDEVEEGFVLACQSVPVTDRIVLDFDA
jgi:ring-1,2-phenylacetyl-CoA epoxidase subunit PaaE